MSDGAASPYSEHDNSVAEARAAIARQHGGWAVEIGQRDGRAVVECVPTGSARLDLGFLTAGEILEIVLMAPISASGVSIHNLSAGAHVALDVARNETSKNVRTLDLHGCHGTVEIVECPRPLKLTVSDSACLIRVATNAAIAPMDALDGSTVELYGGELVMLAGLAKLRVVGTGTYTTPSGDDLRTQLSSALAYIQELEVVEDCELVVKATDLTINAVTGVSDTDRRPTLTINGETKGIIGRRNRGIAGRDSILSSGPPVDVQVRLAHGVVLALAGRATKVRRLRDASRVTFEPPMTVSFEPSAFGTDLTFTAADAPVHIDAGRGAVLTNLAGTVKLGEVAHATLSADTSSFVIADVIDGKDGEAPDPRTGLVLTGVRLPPGMDGRRLLAKLDEAYHFSPDMLTVPGRDQTVWARLRRTRKTTYGKQGTDPRLIEDAEFVRELARLSRSKGAPGSVATKIAWCSYRLRALKAAGRVERAALAAYRLIGYGERPAPAFILWLSLSLLLAGPVLLADHRPFEGTLEGLGRFLLEASRLALGPAAIVTRSGSLSAQDGAEVAEVAARVLTSIPLVTGVLALRNYLKGDSA